MKFWTIQNLTFYHLFSVVFFITKYLKVNCINLYGAKKGASLTYWLSIINKRHFPMSDYKHYYWVVCRVSLLSAGFSKPLTLTKVQYSLSVRTSCIAYFMWYNLNQKYMSSTLCIKTFNLYTKKKHLWIWNTWWRV